MLSISACALSIISGLHTFPCHADPLCRSTFLQRAARALRRAVCGQVRGAHDPLCQDAKASARWRSTPERCSANCAPASGRLRPRNWPSTRSAPGRSRSSTGAQPHPAAWLPVPRRSRSGTRSCRNGPRAPAAVRRNWPPPPPRSAGPSATSAPRSSASSGGEFGQRQRITRAVGEPQLRLAAGDGPPASAPPAAAAGS